MTIQENCKIHLVKEAKEIVSHLQKEQEQYGIDEAMIVSIPHSLEKCLTVYRLLTWGLLEVWLKEYKKPARCKS